MAVDFSLLPVEVPLPDNAPSRFVWTVVFFVLFVTTMFAVLLLWPKELPTRTLQFWFTLSALPLGVSSLVVLRRFSAFEGRKLDVIEQNEATKNFNQCVFDAASKPLAIITVAARVAAGNDAETFEALIGNTLKFKTQQAIAEGGEPLRARWFATPDVVLKAGSKIADRDRQRNFTQWIFDELLDDLAKAIQALPANVDLSVQFAASSALTVEERDVLWTNAWEKRDLRRMRIDAVEQPVGLTSLDVWLDQSIGSRELQCRLIVAFQLHPLLSQTPPEGSAEAAVAMLLMPDALAKRHEVDHQTRLHRPVRSKLTNAYDAMMPALKWAGSQGADISGRWQTGFNNTTLENLVNPGTALALNVKPVNLDESVGFAGVAAPWLALACAIASLSESCSIQMVLSSTDEFIDCAVLRRASADPAFAPRSGVV